MNIQQKIFISILIFFSVMLQAAFLPNFFPTGVVPNILLVIVVFYTFSLGFNSIWKAVFGVGIFLDLISFSLVGMNALALILVAFISSILTRRFLILHSNWKFIIIIILVTVGTAVNELVPALVTEALFFLKIGISGYFNLSFHSLWLKIIYNIIIFMLLYWPFKKIEKAVRLYGNQVNIQRNV